MTSFAHRAVDQVEHLISYAWGLLVSTFNDYTLITLLIFAVLLGFLTTALIAATAYFGLYFVLRLVNHITESIGFVGRTTAQSGAQIAFSLNNLRSSGTVVDGDLLP